MSRKAWNHLASIVDVRKSAVTRTVEECLRLSSRVTTGVVSFWQVSCCQGQSNMHNCNMLLESLPSYSLINDIVAVWKDMQPTQLQGLRSTLKHQKNCQKTHRFMYALNVYWGKILSTMNTWNYQYICVIMLPLEKVSPWFYIFGSTWETDNYDRRLFGLRRIFRSTQRWATLYWNERRVA